MTSIIVNLLYDNNFIDKDEIDAYKYCLDFILEYVIFIIVSLFLGAVFFNMIPVGLFLFFFILLRSYGGGFHAKSHLRCAIYSYLSIIFMIVVSSAIINNWNEPINYCVNIIFVLSFIIYMIFSPVIPHTKKITLEDHHIFKIKSIITGIITFIIYAIFMISGNYDICTAISFGTLFSSAGLIIAKKGVPHES